MRKRISNNQDIKLQADLNPPAPALPPPEPSVAVSRARDKALTQGEQAVFELFRLVDWMRFPDADEVLFKAGLSRASLRTLEADDEVAQCIETRRDALIATPWRLENNSSRNAAWIAQQIAPHVDIILRASFMAVPYGYSVAEVVYQKVSGGRIGIAQISEKPFEWFEPRSNGRLIYRAENGMEYDVDKRKFLLTVRNGSYRQPYGEPLFSRIYWAVFFKAHGRRFWARYLERFGEPVAVGKVSDQEKFIKDLSSLGLAAGLPVGQDDEVTFLSVTQAGEFERFENAMSRSIQKLILGQTLTSDVGGGGSYAAAKVHDSVRMDKRNADARLVAGTVQHLINTLWSLNGFAGAAPIFTLSDDTGLEAARAERDGKLVEKGILKLTKEYLLDRYDFKEGDFVMPDDAGDLSTEPAKIAEKKTEIAEKKESAEFSASQFAAPSQKFTPGQQAIEIQIDALMAGGLPQVLTDEAIKGAIMGATSPDDLHARLAIVLSTADTRQFNETFQRALFAADIMGYAHASAPGSEPAIKEPPTPDPLASLAAQLLQKELAA